MKRAFCSLSVSRKIVQVSVCTPPPQYNRSVATHPLQRNPVCQSVPSVSVLGQIGQCFYQNGQRRVPQGRLGGVGIARVLALPLHSPVYGAAAVDNAHNVFESSYFP